MTAPSGASIGRVAAVLAAATLVLVAPATAAADRGVRVDAGRIAIDDELMPGQTYRLPTIGVSNPGDETTSYTMAVTELSGTTTPDADWFEFEPASFELEPGRTQAVRVTLRIPVSAEASEYTALLAAEIVAGDAASTDGAGIGVGAAAAARLTFNVQPASDLEAVLGFIGTWLDEQRGILSLAVVLVVLALAVRLGRRHLAIEIRRR